MAGGVLVLRDAGPVGGPDDCGLGLYLCQSEFTGRRTTSMYGLYYVSWVRLYVGMKDMGTVLTA